MAENVQGIYALVIRLEKDAHIDVGSLDRVNFGRGTYVYVGSAQANLEQRVRRHLRKEKKLFWHIDHLLSSPAAKIEKAFWMEGAKAAECAVAQELGKRGESVVGFGCSDCRCVSHLFRVDDVAFLKEHMLELCFNVFWNSFKRLGVDDVFGSCPPRRACAMPNSR